MPQTRIGLNLAKPSNNSFFCPINNLHLSKVSPVGVISRVSPQVLIELRDTPMPGLVDLDGMIDVKTGTWNEKALEFEQKLVEAKAQEEIDKQKAFDEAVKNAVNNQTDGASNSTDNADQQVVSGDGQNEVDKGEVNTADIQTPAETETPADNQTPADNAADTEAQKAKAGTKTGKAQAAK